MFLSRIVGNSMVSVLKYYFISVSITPSQKIDVPIENTPRMYHFLSAPGWSEHVRNRHIGHIFKVSHENV